MIDPDAHRGHLVEPGPDGVWIYSDTGELVPGSDRPCGRCGEGRTAEGHDACLGHLVGVTNACCGHGEPRMAYVQIRPGLRIGGRLARLAQQVWPRRST